MIEKNLDLFEADAENSPRIIDISMLSTGHKGYGLVVHWIADGSIVTGLAFKGKNGEPIIWQFRDLETLNKNASYTVYFRGTRHFVDKSDTEKAKRPLEVALIDKDKKVITGYSVVRIINPKTGAQQKPSQAQSGQ